jgi:hypothetical protein
MEVEPYLGYNTVCYPTSERYSVGSRQGLSANEHEVLFTENGDEQ